MLRMHPHRTVPEKPAPDPASMRLRAIFVLFCLLWPVSVSVVPSGWGAVNPLMSAVAKPANTQPAPPAAPEMTDDVINESRIKLESRLAELRLQLLPKAVAALGMTYRGVASPQELQEWEKLTNRLAGILDNQVSTLIRLKNIRTASRDRTVEIKGWQGFPEKPPYPISLLDSLNDAIHAKEINLQAQDVLRSTIEGEFEEFSGGLKKSRTQVHLAEENVEKSAGKPEEQRSQWLLILARLRDEVNQAGVVYGEARRLMLKEAEEGTRAEIDFLSRKLAVAIGQYRFSEEELEQKLQAINKRQQMLDGELDRAEHEGEDALKSLEAAEEAVRKGQAEPASLKKAKVSLDQLLKELELRQVLFDAADFRMQILRGMLLLLKHETGIWQERYAIANGRGTRESAEELKRRQNDLVIIAKWKEYVSSKRSSLQALIKSQQEKLSSASLSRPDRENTQKILTVYERQESLLRRGDEVLNEYEQLARRRNEETTGKQGKVTLAGRARQALAMISSMAGKIWNAELYVAEETIIAEGKKFLKPRSVTLGKLMEAVIILIVGSWVIRRLKRLFHWFATHRLKLSINEAHLYSRLLSYVMFVVVLVGALIFVNIPLAVFAFFGGALAIGIGFGAQNLINNFISGIILMFDRTIKMGDIVEVDGHRGRVTTIGMRSSTIKRFDGVEMLVPNSLFLQQNVTNWTSSDKRARYSISVGVAYGSPSQDVQRLILKAVEDQQEVLHDPPAYVVFDNFADSSLNFTAYFWIELIPEINSLVVFSDIRHRIGERLAGAGIAIPFPQRDLHLDVDKPLEIKIAREGEEKRD